MAGPSRRRPAVFVVLAALVTGLVLVAQGSASSRPNRDEAVQAYLDQVRPGVQQSAAEGADFADVRAHAASLGRDGIDRRLDRLAAEVQTVLTSIDTLTPPASLRVAQAYLVAALGVRSKAVTAARPALDAALTRSTSSDAGVGDAVAQLSSVSQDLGLGDRAFSLFLGSLPPGSGMPPASPWIVDDSQWTAIQLTAFVDQLRSSASATPVHDLAVLAFQTDPGAVSVAPDGTEVIPASHTTSVSVVVENVGNQPEQNMWVRVMLTLDNGTILTGPRYQVSLAPGVAHALNDLRPLVTDPGMQGKLAVSVDAAPGETDLSNNSISVRVQFK